MPAAGHVGTLSVAARVALTNDAQLPTGDRLPNGSPETVRSPARMCHHGMAHSRNFCSARWPSMGQRGVRLFDVKIIVNPQGVSVSFWLYEMNGEEEAIVSVVGVVVHGIGFRYLRVAVALET